MVAIVLLVSACSKSAEKQEETRPVRAQVIVPEQLTVLAEFPGDVRARVESRLGFRVGGKITARKVDAGTSVKRGQVLMELDPADLKLSQQQANAALRAAESNLALARAELARYQELRQKNFVSPAVLDAKESAYRSAQAAQEQALAAVRNQSNQTGYSVLVSDVDGVVTAVEAEVGQVVAAGTPVLKVAKLGEKEVAISIPENKVDVLRQITELRVSTWADPARAIRGEVREMSPVADPATRTYSARIKLLDAPDDVRLGMTANVSFVSRNAASQIRLPLTALLNEKGKTSVWIVDKGVVRLMPVILGGVSGNDVIVAGGLTAGQTVVTAGVNLLKPGQKVSLLNGDPATVAAAAPAAVAGANAGAANKATGERK